MWMSELNSRITLSGRLLLSMSFALIALLLPIVARNALAADFTISGIVRDEQGTAIEHIRVTVKRFLYYDNFERPVWSDVISGTTSITGEYSLAVPNGGPFRIEFADAVSPRRYHGEYFDDKQNLNASTEILFAEGQSSYSADAHLTTIQPITGHVTDESGNPLENIQVSTVQLIGDPKLEHRYWGNVTHTTTDASGAYTLTAPETTPFRIEFLDASPSPHYLTEYYDNVGWPTQGIDILFDKDHAMHVIDARLAIGSVITGQVADSQGNPISLAGVFAGNLVADNAGQIFLQDGGATTSDLNGYYTLTLPLSGTVGVGVRDNLYPERFAWQYYENVKFPQQPTSVTVKIGEVTPNINFQVLFYGIISGKVTDTSGSPLNKISVTAHRSMTDTFGNEFWLRISQIDVTDTAGNYELPVGTGEPFRLCFNLQPYPGEFIPFMARCYGSSLGDPAGGSDLNVQLSQVITGTDIQLTRYPRVSGQVTGTENQPLTNVSINSYQIITTTQGEDIIVFSELYAMTDSNGHYELWVIDPGNFGVTANPLEPSPYTREYYENQVQPAQSEIFTYEGDLVLNLDFQLSLKGNITGTVVNSVGQALAAVSVTAFHYFWDGSGGKSWLPYASATTDEQGVYTISQVLPDTYRIGFGLNQEYTPQFYPYTTTLESASDIVLGLGESATNIDGQLVQIFNTLSVQLISTPQSIRNLHFSGPLGDFALDDPALDDGDAYTNEISFTLPSAIYSFTLTLPSDRFLQNVSCQDANNLTIDGPNFQVSLVGGKIVTCTVEIAAGAKIQTFSYHDANGDGMFNEGESPQAGITVTVHNITSAIDMEQVSNENGLTEFVSLPPNHSLFICQSPPIDWVNSQPGFLDGQFGSPCYSGTLQANQLATIRFGNIEASDPDFQNVPSTSPDGYVITEMPLVNDTNEEGEVQMNVYLPLVSR